MNDNDKISQIKNYFSINFLNDELGDIYARCLEAKFKYTAIDDYYFTDDDRYSFIMLASAWSALLRKTWRIFITNMKYEPFMFWNAFIQVFIFQQRILLMDWWEKVFTYDEKLKNMISKTSNPAFIERMFTGLDWKWLLEELSTIE